MLLFWDDRLLGAHGADANVERVCEVGDGTDGDLVHVLEEAALAAFRAEAEEVLEPRAPSPCR